MVGQVGVVKTLYAETCAVCLSVVVHGITLAFNVRSTHTESHLRATTVLNGCVAAKLDEVSESQHHGNMVSHLTDLCNLILGVLYVRAVGDFELVLQHHSTARSSINFSSSQRTCVFHLGSGSARHTSRLGA